MAKSLSELKPKPVIVEPPKPAAAPPTAPLPEPAVSAEIETTEAPKPKKPAAAVPAAAKPTTPAAAPAAAKTPAPAEAPAPIPAPVTPVTPVRSTDSLRATGGTRLAAPVVVPKAVKAAVPAPVEPVEVAPIAEPPSLPTYGFSQGDGHVLWSALRAEWEKENYRGERAKAPEQVFSDFAAARGMTVDDLRASAAAAGTDLEKIREVAQRKQNRADSLQDFNRLQLGGRYSTPEKARQAAVAEATAPAATEDDSYSLVVRQSPTTDLITDTPEEDLEVTHTAAGKAHAQAVVDRIDPERLVRFQQGFSRYAQDSSRIFAEAATDILRKHGVIFDVIGPDGEKHKIRMFADNALAAKDAMKDAGIDFGEQQDAVAAKVANEAFRRATARAINEAAAAYTLGHFANPIRARISFSQLAGLARPDAFDPMADDSPLFTIGAPIVDARARVERGEYVDAAAQAFAPITQIVGFAEIPGRTNHWPVLIREAAAIETAGDWTDTPYAVLRAHFQPAIDAMEAGDRAGAAKQLALNLVSFGHAKLDKGGNIVARSPEEIYADTLASIEQRQTAFEDVSQSELLETALKKAMFLSWAAQKAGVAPPDRYNLDYNGDGKIDAEDEKAGWREAEDDVAFGIQNLTAFGAAVVTLDALDAMAAIHASRLMRAAIRATEFKPRAVTLLDDTAKALEAGRFDEAGSLERKIEYRPGHSGEPQGAAVAAPEGNAPELGQVSRITETTLAHEAKVLGKADEMFDEAIEGALPDIPGVVTSPTGDVPRRFYLHGSVRTKNAPIITTEDLRARYDFQHRYNVVKALEDAVAAGTDTYVARLMPRLQKSLDEMLATLKMPEEQVARVRDWWGKAIARGEDISTMLEPALEAQMKGDDLKNAKKASSDFGARLKKEHATAKAEGRIAVERARRAVDQQVRVRIAALRKTAEFARGGDASMFGRWMQEKMPAVRNWFAGFRKPKDLIELVDSETLRLAAAADNVTPIDMKAAVKSLDSAERSVAKQRLALEAAQVAGDEAVEKKVARLLKAAVTKRDRLVREIAASINGRGHVLSDAGVEHFLRMRAADAGQTAADEIMPTAILLDVRAEKMVEEGVVKTLEEAHARISWRRSDTVESDALLQRIDVDGVQRPTTNSAGRPIHPTEEGTRNFWRWFGDSKVVDAEGRPLVVYHGTSSGGFEAFKPNVRKNEQLGFGIHFAIDEDFARRYAEDENVARRGKTPQTYSVYLKSGSPLLADSVVVEGTPEFALAKNLAGSRLVTDADESGRRITYLQHAIDATNPQRAERLLREAGYDSVRYGATIVAPGHKSYRKVAESQSWVVFDPTQVKSAVGNVGTFDSANTSILRQDETPDFIEPERLSRGPRVVRGESGEMSPRVADNRTMATVRVLGQDIERVVDDRMAALTKEHAAFGDVAPEGGWSEAEELRAAEIDDDLQRLASVKYDVRFLSDLNARGLTINRDHVIDRFADSFARMRGADIDVADFERRWGLVLQHIPTDAGEVNPLAVLPPQKVPTDPVEMTRVVRDTPWFHGAVRGEVQLREYDPSKHAGSSAGLMLGPGLYLAENPEVAIRYATAGGGAVGTAPGKAALKTIMVSPERVLDVRPVEGRRYSDVLAERLEAVGLAEDARIVRDSYINGAHEIGNKWLNRLATYEMTLNERSAADVVGLGFDRMTERQISSLLDRVAEVTDEPPMTLIEEAKAAYKRLNAILPQIDGIFVKYPSIYDAPADVQESLRQMVDEQRRLQLVTDKIDGFSFAIGRQGIEITDEIRDIRTNEILTNDEIIARWQRLVEAKKTLEGAWEKAKNASFPTQRLLEHFDGLFHFGSRDGNVLVLFDPNGKIGGRPIITAESRVLPERVVYQTDDFADAKAYVQFEADGKALVTLMKKADASSFLHESAHIFRRTLDEKDNATILRWTKAAGLDVELQNGLFIGPDAVKAEEMFARAFERFVMEGKTSVKGLRRLFENLKNVMLRIYRGSKALNVEISPEIEILFNRMLAPKSVATDATPTIHAAAPKTSASKWLAAQSKGLLKAEDILPALEAGDTVRLPFRVFGKDEINLDDFLRLQLQLDEIAASPSPAFKLPFSEVRQQVVEDTLVGDIQSATSGPVPRDVTAIPFVVSKVLATIPFGADAFQKMRVFAPRFREMAQSAGRLLNQRVGDMNVFLREARAADQYLPIIRYMTGERQAFRVGGRQPLSAGHDAVREIGIILEDSHKALKNSVVKVSESIDPQYKAAGGVAHYVDANGEVVETVAGAAKVGEMEVELAVLARMVTDQPTPALRSRAVDEQLGSRKNQNIVRAVVTAMMTTGGTDDASNTVFRHLGMALLNNGVMEGVPVSNVVRTAKVPHMLAYVDALHRLGGFDVVDNVLVPNNRTSAERLQDFIDVLDRAGFGPEGINRALVVVNAFGAQRSLYTHISGLGAAFTKEQVQSFHRFLNGDVRSARDYADGLRLFKQFGLNREALEEAAGLLEESSGRYIPASVQRSIDSALSRALDETADKGNTDMVHTAAKWILQVWQRSVVRGNFVPKAAKAWMDVMDTFFMVSAEAGFNSGARAAGRQALQSAFISFQGHLLGRLHLGPSKTDKIRSALQNFADWMTSPTGQKTVNKVLQGSDELYRTADGRVYRYSDILKVAIRNGTVSSFESSDLRESIRRAQEASKVAGGNVVRRAANDVGRGVRNAGTTVLHANSELFEAWAERERVGATMTLVEAGMNPEEASRAITRALFDYPGSLAAAETKGTWSGVLLTTAQPFWAFTKNSNHYTFNAIERPEVMYRLTRIRRAVEYGQEAVSQTIYSFYVDPYGFDFNEMSPETRASYFHLRYAYEESLGKLPHEMTEEERLTFAAALMSSSPDNAMQVADGQTFRLPEAEAASLARKVSRLEGGVDIAASYRPEPRRDLLTDYQRKKMTAFFPAKRTGMIDGYVRSTQQQDLQYAVAFFEPAPIAGMTFLANTLALYAYPLALLSENQRASTAQTSRALEYLVDPERMPLRTQVAAIMQTGQPQQVSPPLAWAIQESGFGAWIYPVSEPINAPSRDFDLSVGMSTDVAGRTKPMRWYAIDPNLNMALQVGLYDINQLGMKVTSGGGAFDRDRKWDILRRVVGVLGPASVTETSQRAAAKKAMYEIPPEAKPR